jgi:predicted AlkP superfamily phosphohydrolase/phosphomutase
METVIKAPPKVIILGLDGGSLELITRWAGEGLLPNFREFLYHGVSGPLTSIIPPITAAAWTSFMTGKNPGKHGLYDFMEPSQASYEMRFTNARSRRTDTIWQMLNAAGLRVGVFNVPMTFPPDPVDGFMISGMDTPLANSDFVYPPALHEELSGRFGQISIEPRHLGFMKNDQLRAQLLEEIKTQETGRTDMLFYLLAEHPVDVAMLVYRATDIVQHFFWHYHDPSHHWHPGTPEHPFASAILEIYQHLDRELGRLFQSLPTETTFLIMSDHGAGGTGGAWFHANRFLHQNGYLALKTDQKKRGGFFWNSLLSRADKFLRSRLTPDQKSKLAFYLPGLRRRWEDSASGYNLINWSDTRAFANETSALTPGVWINLRGRFPQGVVEPGQEYRDLVADLKSRLTSMRWEGRPLIADVYHRDEVYSGPYLEQAPDLILNWWKDASYVCKASFAGEAQGPIVEGDPGYRPDRSEWSGTHRLDGVVMLKSPFFRQGVRLEKAHILDLAPTLLYLLGLPVPEDFDGRVLQEAFVSDFLETHVLNSRKAAEEFRPLQEETYTPEEAEKIAAKLKEMGYLD